MLEYNLIISGKPNFIAEDCIRNWDEISYSMKRDGFSGIVRSFSSKFEFTKEAYEMLVNEYVTKGLNASAQIEIYELDNKRGKAFLFGSYLDWGTFEYDDTCVYINASDSSLAAKVKAKKNTQYEYSVASLKETECLKYDRMMMNSKIVWLYAGGYREGGSRFDVYYNTYDSSNVVPVYIESSEISVKNSVEVRDCNIGVDIDKFENQYFFRNIGEDDISLNIDILFNFAFESNGGGANANIELRLYNRQGESTLLHSIHLDPRVSASPKLFSYKNQSLLIPSDGKLVFAAIVSGSGNLIQRVDDADCNRLTIEFYKKDKPVDVDAIKPVTLLNQLMKSINDGADGFVGEIEETDGRVSETMLLAGESIRGIKDAKIYISLKKFSEWMEAVFGYVPYIENNKYIYKKREDLYVENLQGDINSTGYEFSVKQVSNNIYSKLKIGYEKQEYDSVNGRDEFRFTNEYDTGISITDNSLELISQIRADAYGIEFLAAKRGEDTTDSDSDKELFFVGARLDGDKYTLIRDGFTATGLISPDTMFNMMFSPRACVESNKKYIASFMQNIVFASSEGNGNVVINGIAENSDIKFDDKDNLFTASTLSIETADGKIPKNVHGMVELKRNGYLYTCFINEVEYKLGLYKGVKYELQIKKITKL